MHTDEDVSRLKYGFCHAECKRLVHNYITDFNSLEMISASDGNAQMKKSANADLGDFPLWRPCFIGTLSEGDTYNDLTEYSKN